MGRLDGERLDIRHCETLEDVFKRVQFKVIDLENANLEDESAIALFDMFEYYESTKKLVLASNRNIGPRGWQAAARYLKRTESLECLDVRNCNVTELSMPVIGRSLRVGTTVSSLHLENCNLSGRPFFVLMSSLKMNQTVKDLFLADNRLVPSDAIQMSAMLKFNWTVKLIDLRNNHIQNVGVAHICDGLVEQKDDGLGTLVLWNNGITHVGMAELARALPECNNLDTLNLGHNVLTDEGVLLLKDGLLRNGSILRLGLVNTRITCEGAIALAEYLADGTKLIRLDVRENDIKTGGLMALMLALKVNRSLLRLDIDKDIKKETMNGHEDIQKSLQDEIGNYTKRNRELAKDEEAKNQVIEAQKALERSTLNRSKEDVNKTDNSDHLAQVNADALDSPDLADVTHAINGELVIVDNVQMHNDSQASALVLLNSQQEGQPSVSQSSSVAAECTVTAGLSSAMEGASNGNENGLQVGDQSTFYVGISNNEYVAKTVAQPNANMAKDTMCSAEQGTNIDAQTAPNLNDFDDNSAITFVNTKGDGDAKVDFGSVLHNNTETAVQVPNGLLKMQNESTGIPVPDIIHDNAVHEKKGLSTSPDEFEKELDEMLASVTAASLDEVTQLPNIIVSEDEDIFDK
uniref:Protein phosphatase 1 regulatory subunit 37-like n=1 Tax=Saccoglossus kowalevskii TaxID=10224 RepID=A0ABM0MAL2_SACKO|nr:PREDICTED: protein phosphatase 1 regulatory subunit 37-like [Saccoglossus kowalevskii]